MLVLLLYTKLYVVSMMKCLHCTDMKKAVEMARLLAARYLALIVLLVGAFVGIVTDTAQEMDIFNRKKLNGN